MYYKSIKRVVSGLLALLLLCGMAYAVAQNVKIKVNDGAMTKYSPADVIPEGDGFVQCIKGSPGNPPTGTATGSDGKIWSGNSYAIIDAVDVKGPVGHFPAAGAGAGGFVKQGLLDNTLNASYFIRYWDDEGYYANSATKKPWTSGDPVPWGLIPAEPFGSFTFYKAAAPYACIIASVNQIESLEKQLYPVDPDPATEQSTIAIAWSGGTSSSSDANIQVKGDGSHQAYVLEISRSDTFNGLDDLSIPKGSASANLDKKNTYAAFFNDVVNPYYARVAAYNYFGSTTGPSIPFQLAEAGALVDGVGIGPLTMTGFFVFDEPDDPYKYGLTYFVPHYVRNTSSNIVVTDVNGNGWLDCDDVLTLLDTALKLKGNYDVLEVNYWNEDNQQWDVAAQWMDWGAEEARYWVNSVYAGDYEYPETVAEVAAVPFADGVYLYIGLGKIDTSGSAADGWRMLTGTASAADGVSYGTVTFDPALVWPE